MHAQSDPLSVSGSYFLKNTRETAAGFQLKPDGSFSFFFSYGALDRQSKGSWKLEKDSISFQSSGDPQNDFIPGKCSKVPGESIHITLEGTHPGINPFFRVKLMGKNGFREKTSSSSGIYVFDKVPFDTIAIQFEWCPEKEYRYPVIENGCNNFLFTVQPSILDVHFSAFRMRKTGNQLTGTLPFLSAAALVFEKE